MLIIWSWISFYWLYQWFQRYITFTFYSIFFFKALKAISETEIMQEKGKKAMEKGQLEEAYDLYTSYLTKLDKHLAPPYPDYYRIQQSIWKCIWMRFGNRVVRAKAVKPAVTADDYDTVD